MHDRQLGEEHATLLVVDDERGPRESLRMILSPRHRVLLAEDGVEALEILRTTPVDLVTLDLNMPGMKGADLMRLIRREHPEIEVIVITGHGTLETAVESVRSGVADYLQKPFDVVQVSAAVLRALARRRGRRHLVGFLDRVGEVLGGDRPGNEIFDGLETNPRLERRMRRLLEDMGWAEEMAPDPEPLRRTMELLEVLAETIESQNPYLRGHARRVAFYAGLLSDRLCLSAEEQERVRIAAFLHDLGKIGVPSDLLLKPSALTTEERVAMEKHPEIGARLIEPLAILRGVTAAVRHHHEWWDGRGYPDGIQGESIPLAARIIGLADAYDAMTSDRPYRKALALDEVCQELKRFAGLQFDPSLAKEFLTLVEMGACDSDLPIIAEAVSDLGTSSGVGSWAS